MIIYLNETTTYKLLKIINLNELNENDIKISHPGAFTDYCKSQGFDGVTCECICKAMKSNDKTLHKRANFAYNFGFKKKGKICKCMEKLKKAKK